MSTRSPTGQVRARVAVAGLILLLTGSRVAAQTLAPADAISPSRWADLALADCHAARGLVEAADGMLADRLASIPRSREQAAFLAAEARVRERGDHRARRAALARVDALLFGGTARFPDTASGSRDSFRDVLSGLLGRESVCAIEAIEATVLFAAFGVPFDAAAARDLRPDREFQRLDALVRRHAATGRPLEDIYVDMRGAPSEVVPYITAVARAAIETAAAPDGSPGFDGRSGHRLQQFLEFVTYAAEPVRIRSYLHAKVDQVEGALRTTLPEAARSRLLTRAEQRLFRSVDDMRRLRGMSPRAVLDALGPIVDRWFRDDAVPALRTSLSRDPFAAYWFFVQTGGVASPGRTFKGSRVPSVEPAFTLGDVARLRTADALARIDAIRVPAPFLDRHAALESVFTEVTLSRDEVLARIESRRMNEGVRARLRQLVLAQDRFSRLSTLDVFSRVIRDASRISGRVDRQLVAALSDALGAE